MTDEVSDWTSRKAGGRKWAERTYDAPVTPQNWAIRSSLIFDFDEDLDC